MRFISNLTVSLLRLAAGLCILLFSAGIPSYFTAVDKAAVSAAGKDTTKPADVARIYFDAAKISTALMVARTSGDSKDFGKTAEKLYREHPNWLAAGGDEPFFDAFYSSLSDGAGSKNGYSVYSVLSASDIRAKLLIFLSQTQSGLVRSFLDLRKMTSSLLPPVFTSAGAPLDCALLTSALLAQTGDFNTDFLKDLTRTFEKMKGDSESKEKFEKYCLGILALSKDLDWTRLRSLVAHFDSLGQVYSFARLYSSAPSPELREVLVSALLLTGDVDGCLKYLSGAELRKWEDFAFAYRSGEGSLDFIMEQNRPIYKNSAVAEILDPVCAPIKSVLGECAAEYPAPTFALKILLSVLGGYMASRGFFRIFLWRRDTPSWISPFVLARGLLEGAIVATLFFVLIEPDFLSMNVENAPEPELRFAFENTLNTIAEETMKTQTDPTALMAIALFITIQLTVYIICLIRFSAIKRAPGPAELKLKLLENEENLFDMGLYVGLAGTIASLALLTLKLVSMNLMVASYTSTLFGILFTMVVKIIHVRRYRRKLLIEVSHEK